MTQIAPRTLRRPQSLAWIAPSGEFIPIEGELMHSDLAESFPGMPPDEIYPTNYAMNRLGYLKVGNAFDFALKGDEVPRGVDRPAQMDTMAQVVAQAVINFMSKGLPSWFLPARNILDNPEMWPIYQGDISDGSISRPTVKRFINTHGSDDTREWFDYQMRRAEEALIRQQVRTILREMLRRPV
jgi:hypothetical protein